MKIWVCGLLLAAAGVTNAAAGTFPEPAIVQSPSQWTLNVSYDQPQQITVKLPGEKEAKRFWYIILTLTNESSFTDAPFYPYCQLMTDTFQVVTAGKGVRKEVFDLIKLKHQGSYPFLECLDYVDNKILQGADNAVDVAIIWPDFDVQAKEVTIFIGGLSNETCAIGHPLKKDENGKPEMVYLRKTLALKYGIGGDPRLRDSATLRFLDQTWVMR
ncbi:MAG TPA: hypothetical protein PLY61_03385 [Anaerohalosphaeraceae bacterium]|jgi:hypothetical protein|nr:hypothetical protein [Anaerohalosphaeraceae bacterium]HRT85670.1 hypothetical protein [Anaerohalosphaeraceae bacterium]